VTLEKDDPDVAKLLARYDAWRRIYSYAGESPPDEADWEDGRLFFRFGYPHPDWWAYVLEDAGGDYRVSRISTERSAVPIESLKGRFSRIQDAGKFMIYEVAESLRINCRLEPLSWKWDDEGLDSHVEAQIKSDREVKYALRGNPQAYFIMTRGDMPYSHILPLSYDDLDANLLNGFSDSVVSRVNAEMSK
jgi:hypothetical protein